MVLWVESCLPGQPLLHHVRESLKFRANNQERTAHRDRIPATELQKKIEQKGTFGVLSGY